MAEPLLCLLATCRLPGRHGEDCEGGDCRGCQRARAADGLRLCQRDTERIGQDATTAAELYDELALRLAGGTGSGEPVSGTSDTTRLPNPAAVEARATIRHTLVAWCRLISEERGWSLPVDDVGAMASYVGRSAEWLAAGEYADEAATELRELRQQAWSVCYPRGVRTVPLPGPDGKPIVCLVEGCGGIMTGLFDAKACDADRKGFEFPPVLMCSANAEHDVPSTGWHAFARAVKARAA